jgi:hypothetical protein
MNRDSYCADLREALQYARGTMLDLVAQRPVLDLDEQIARIDKLLAQPSGPQSPATRSSAAFPENYRKVLEGSNLPVEVAVAIADALDARNGPSDSGWILTSERQPEGDRGVLASGPSVTTEGRWRNIVSAGYVRRNPNFCTHWQPLPDVPSPATKESPCS